MGVACRLGAGSRRRTSRGGERRTFTRGLNGATAASTQSQENMRPSAPEKETAACSSNQGTSSVVSPSPGGLALVLAVGHLRGRSSPGVCRWAPSDQRRPGLDARQATRRTHAVGSLGAPGGLADIAMGNAAARGHRAEPAELAKPIQIGETVHTRHHPRGSGPAPPDACVPPPAPTAKTAVVPQTRSPAPLITPTPGSARGCVECTAAAEGRSRENPTPGGRPGHPAPLSIHTNTLTEREQ